MNRIVGIGRDFCVLLVFLWFPAGLAQGLGQAADQTVEYLVTDFGAVGDGQTLNTSFIQKAIDQCAEAGGGRVVIGVGSFLTGTIVMRDHVELHVSRGAVLLGSTHIIDYPEMVTPYRFLRDEWVRQSLIFGANLENISITGGGLIDGQGAAFEVKTKLKPDRYKNRPFLIRFTECTNVTVREITLQNSAMWMQHYLACDRVLIDGIRVYNHCNQNNDMIDIDGCRDVVITNCTGDTDDDGITLKSTSPRACENITISNCVISSHCNAIKLGTESTGGFRNITITDCVIKPSEKKEVIYGLREGISGISLEVVDGGHMDGVFISDVTMNGPEVPLFIRLGNRARPYREGLDKPSPGSLENISIQNIVAKNVGKTGCSVTGIEGFPVRDVSIHNVTLELPGGVGEEGSDREVPELEDQYPEATMFGLLPASILYMRHVEQINLSGLNISFREPDERYHLVADDVVGLEYSGIHMMKPELIRVLTKQ